MRNKVVVHFLNGRLVKGVTLDFVPAKPKFHVFDPEDEKKVAEVPTKDLKAIFFVKSFAGNPSHKPRGLGMETAKAPGRTLRVAFRDGEVIVGVAAVYVPGREGFFLVPVDADDNNERIYVYTHATTSVDTLKPSVAS